MDVTISELAALFSVVSVFFVFSGNSIIEITSVALLTSIISISETSTVGSLHSSIIISGLGITLSGIEFL